MALDLPFSPAITAALFLSPIFLFLYWRCTAHRYLPPSMPWIGVRKERFGKYRAHAREWKEGRAFLFEGYEKYNKRSLSWATPNITWKPEVMIAPEHIPWLLKQPKSILSTEPVRDSIMGMRFTAFPELSKNRRVLYSVLLKNLSRHLGQFTAETWDEIDAAFKETWSGAKSRERETGEEEGGDEEGEWVEVSLYKGMQDVALRATNRVFLGKEKCRDPILAKNVLSWAHLMATTGALLRILVPDVLLPVLGPLVALPCNWRGRQSIQMLLPDIRQQLDTAVKAGPSDDNSGKQAEGDDGGMIHWLVQLALAADDPGERRPEVIAQRLLFLDFAAIHTTAMTLVNLVVDLVAADPSEQYLESIRIEAEEALAAAGGTWTREALSRLHKADSAIRETLRYWGFGGRGVVHQVMPREGVVLPDGQWLPQGAWVGIPVGPIHRDDDVYANANTYDAFRFFNEREEVRKKLVNSSEGSGPEKTDARFEELLREKKLGLVSVGERFLAFGVGRDACPGRFFAAQQLKLILVYIIMNYEIKPLNNRPEPRYISDFILPPFKTKLWIRRRERSTTL